MICILIWAFQILHSVAFGIPNLGHFFKPLKKAGNQLPLGLQIWGISSNFSKTKLIN